MMESTGNNDSDTVLNSVDAEVVKEFAKANNLDINDAVAEAFITGIRSHYELENDGDMLAWIRRSFPKFMNN